MKQNKQKTGPSDFSSNQDWFIVLCLNKHFILWTRGIQRLKWRGQWKLFHLFTEYVSDRQWTAFEMKPSLCLISIFGTIITEVCSLAASWLYPS